MTILEVKDIRVRYSAKGPEILKGISFEVEENDFFAIIGPSGAGKSTLIRCINRLLEPTSGSIKLRGQDVLKLNQKEQFGLRFGMEKNKDISDHGTIQKKISKKWITILWHYQ